MKGKKLDLSAVLQKKSVLLLLLAGGLLLLLLPRSSVREAVGSGEDVCTEAEKRLCAVLSQMDGVGEAYVLLSEEPNHRGVFTGGNRLLRRGSARRAAAHCKRRFRLYRTRQQSDYCGRTEILGG